MHYILTVTFARCYEYLRQFTEVYKVVDFKLQLGSVKRLSIYNI